MVGYLSFLLESMAIFLCYFPFCVLGNPELDRWWFLGRHRMVLLATPMATNKTVVILRGASCFLSHRL